MHVLRKPVNSSSSRFSFEHPAGLSGSLRVRCRSSSFRSFVSSPFLVVLLVWYFEGLNVLQTQSK